MSRQEEAELLAMESILRFGFVVVGYCTDFSIGEKTEYLWRDRKMPQPFTIVREATSEEFEQQMALFRELFGRSPLGRIPGDKLAVLITD